MNQIRPRILRRIIWTLQRIEPALTWWEFFWLVALFPVGVALMFVLTPIKQLWTNVIDAWSSDDEDETDHEDVRAAAEERLFQPDHDVMDYLRAGHRPRFGDEEDGA